MSHSNGTVMVKYIKIKSGTKGVKACADYIENPEKTIEKQNSDEASGLTANLKRIFNYAEDDKKTFDSSGKQYVSAINCRLELAMQEFALAEKHYHMQHTERLNAGHKANQAFHIIVSYKGTDLTPQEVHDMGIKFARTLCSDTFSAVISTHLNTENYHNHILVNAYARDGTHKLYDQKDMYKYLRNIADNISAEHNLPINENGLRNHMGPYKEWSGKDEKKKIKIKNSEVKRLKNNYDNKGFYQIDCYGSIHINSYDDYGRERSLLEKIFLFIIAGIKEGIIQGFETQSEIIKAYEHVDSLIETMHRYDINAVNEIDDKLRYYHSMKGAGLRETYNANTDDGYLASTKKVAEATEAIRAIYKLKMDIERNRELFSAIRNEIISQPVHDSSLSGGKPEQIKCVNSDDVNTNYEERSNYRGH